MSNVTLASKLPLNMDLSRERLYHLRWLKQSEIKNGGGVKEIIQNLYLQVLVSKQSFPTFQYCDMLIKAVFS